MKMTYNCRQCGSVSEYTICPDCRRNEELAEEQRNIAFALADAEEDSKKRLQHDAHVKDVLRKLLDLAVESVEDLGLAEKKVKVIMQSAVFTQNESDFFDEIKANNFLADCYYTLRLGAKPDNEQVAQLSDRAKGFLKLWADSHKDSNYAEEVKKLYAGYLTQKAEQDKADEVERAKQQVIWEKEEAEREKKRLEREVAAEKRRLAERAADLAKRKSRRVYVTLAVFLGLLGVHHFYAGYYKQGVIQLLLFPLFIMGPIGIVVAIISIIWIFKVIFGTNAVCEDAKGNYFKEYA
jgi:TM2 domain-containing membrane protein YozV